jgi:hypothetical protein
MTISLKGWVRHLRRKLSQRRRVPVKVTAAVVTLGLATAWGTDATATDVHLHVRPTEAIYEPYALYYNLNGSYTALFDLGSSIPGGQTTLFQHSLPWAPSEFRGYSVIGLHGPVDERGLTLSFPVNSRIANGGTWESFITEVYGAPDRFYPTPWIIEQWGDNYASTFQLSFPGFIETDFGTRATITNYSVADYGGWALAKVPEPDTFILLVTVGYVLTPTTRRRSQ